LSRPFGLPNIDKLAACLTEAENMTLGVGLPEYG
jgi:hypothetical protein